MTVEETTAVMAQAITVSIASLPSHGLPGGGARHLPGRDLLPAHEHEVRGRVHNLEDRAGAPSRSRAKGSGRSGWPRTRP